MSDELRVIVEHVYEGKPGEGYEAGYELGNMTKKGYYARTPEAALIRLLQDQASGCENLAAAAMEDARTVRALTFAITERLGIDIEPRMAQKEYRELKMFGSTRIDEVERDRNALLKLVDNLTRCPHGRRDTDNCCECLGGWSVGGVLKSSDIDAARNRKK